MTDKKLYIVPYVFQRTVRLFLANQMNHVLMDKDAEFEGDAKQVRTKRFSLYLHY
jgi:hypothetical protein